jgi:23S rRNA pseudouridine1911/1915/1917 synthase
VAKSQQIELGDGTRIAILYEDRSVLAIDKPEGWMCAPTEWDRTSRNLQRALESSLAARDFWAKCRNLKFLRFVHRLDAETTGVLVLAKSLGALRVLSRLFEERQVDKTYLAVVQGVPAQATWTCRMDLAPDPARPGRMVALAKPGRKAAGSPARRPDAQQAAKIAETRFRMLQISAETALVEACPLTGRTHQIRVHLAAGGHPVLGDRLYGAGKGEDSGGGRGATPGRRPRESGTRLSSTALALRAMRVAYRDPFGGKLVRIEAPCREFAAAYGFTVPIELDPSAGRANAPERGRS